MNLIAISSLSWRSGRIDTTARPAILDAGRGHECQQRRRSATFMDEEDAKRLMPQIRIAYATSSHEAQPADS